ncbi:IS630 transposase-related protein [Candidatus Regiella insecticola]
MSILCFLPPYFESIYILLALPKIGRHFIQAVAIEGFPLESHPGILSSLAELPIEYRWSSRFIFMDQHEAISHLEKFRKKWKQKVRGFFDQVFNTNSGHIDEDAMMMVADASSAIAETNSNMVAQGYYTSVVILMNENREQIEAAACQIEKSIARLGFSARVETINTMDAFLGSLPGHGVENIRRPIINTMNLADLLPTSTIWTGENRAPSPLFPPNAPALLHAITSGNSPFRMNLHVRDLGHGIIFGPTRTGKSTKLGLIELAPYFMMYTNLMTYPLKFRQHVLAIKEKLTYAKTASRFGVGMASLMRWNRRITPCTTHNKPATKIDMEALAQDVATYPDDYQYERAQRFGVSAQGIRHALKRLRVSRKKNTSVSQS